MSPDTPVQRAHLDRITLTRMSRNPNFPTLSTIDRNTIS